MAEDLGLPEGFVLDKPQDSGLPEGFEIDQTAPVQPSVQNRPNVGGRLLELAGIGALGGLGFGAKKAYQAIRKPEIRKEYKQTISDITDIQKQIPSALGKESIVGTTPEFTNAKLNEISQGLKQQLNSFDETIVSLTAKDLANTVKSNYSSWLKNATETYSQGLDAIDDIFIRAGKSFTNQNLTTELLDKTINVARSRGVLDTDLSSLLKIKDVLEKQYTTQVIPFSNVKGYVASLINENPTSPVSGILRERWGEFLEKNAPDEAIESLSKLNKSYKTFAQARTQLERVVDPRTGMFNTSKLNKYLINFTKKRLDDGTGELMKLLVEGSDLTKPMEGVESGFKSLSELKTKRFANESQIREQIDKMKQMRSKLTELTSRSEVLGEKIGVGKMSKVALAKGLVKMFFGKTILPAVVLGKLDPVQINEDTDGALMATIGGRLAPKGSKEREEQEIRAGLII